MKLYLILICTGFLLAISSCQKCETCVPYHYNLGVLGSPDRNAQSIKLCDKTDITAYQSLTGFSDEYRDTVKFICQ